MSKKKHLTFVGCFLFVVRHVPCVHLCLEFGDFLVCYVGGFAVVIVILKQTGEEVFDGLAFTVAHGVHCSENGFGDELVAEPATSAVASDDAIDLPECNLVEELMARDSYLTNEQLVDVPRRG